jgi:hypothetical protein
MRLARFCIVAGLAALPSLPHGSVAWAADTLEAKTVLKPPCGSSAKDAIAAAEKALATRSADNQTRALACLIEAMKAVQAARLDGGSDDDNRRVLMVPRLEARKPQ